MERSRCLCRNQPIERLIPAYTERMTRHLEEQIRSGKPVNFATTAFTCKLVKALVTDQDVAFAAKYRELDHHLEECVFSPHYQPDPPL